MPMKSRSARSSQSGYSLLEVLIVLAVLMLVVGVVASRMTGPSDRLELERVASAAVAAAATDRLRALRSGSIVTFSVRTGAAVRAAPCSETAPDAPAIMFLPDGHATGGPLCFAAGARRLTVSVDWLTGVATTSIE